MFVNMKDHQVFQDKDRKHGYSYQAAVFPNGHLVVNSLHSVLFLSPLSLLLLTVSVWNRCLLLLGTVGW